MEFKMVFPVSTTEKEALLKMMKHMKDVLGTCTCLKCDSLIDVDKGMTECPSCDTKQ